MAGTPPVMRITGMFARSMRKAPIMEVTLPNPTSKPPYTKTRHV